MYTILGKDVKLALHRALKITGTRLENRVCFIIFTDHITKISLIDCNGFPPGILAKVTKMKKLKNRVLKTDDRRSTCPVKLSAA